MAGLAWVNGTVTPAEDAVVSLFDSGFMGGVSVFDTLAAWQGSLFKLDTHLARFERSAHAAMIPLERSGADLRDLVMEVTRESGLADAYVQVIATRGRRPLAEAWTDTCGLMVYAVPYFWIVPREKIETGISVVIPSVRNWPSTVVDAKIKNFNRLHGHFAKVESDLAGADDVVLLDANGYLTESRSANLFVVRGGTIYSPRTGILEGITRETVFEIAADLGLPAAERDMTPFDLYVAEEAFLSTTAGGIIPVVMADGRVVGDGSRGPITRQVHDVYWERHVSGPDLTPVGL